MIKLDVCGIPCPEPAHLTRCKLRKMRNGDLIQVKSNSRNCVKDLEKMCLYLDHTHVKTDTFESYQVITIMKGLVGES